MDEDGNDALGVPSGVAVVFVLAGAGHPQHDGVDVLQVAGVRRQSDSDGAPVAERVVSGGSVVVLDVAGARVPNPESALGRDVPLERAQQLVVGDSEDVRQDVEASPVGHPDDHFRGAVGGRQLDRFVQHRHQHVGAFDGEALLAPVDPVQELLQALYLGQAVESAPSAFVVVVGEVRARLHLTPQPFDLARVLQVLELVAEGAAVRGP